MVREEQYKKAKSLLKVLKEYSENLNLDQSEFVMIITAEALLDHTIKQFEKNPEYIMSSIEYNSMCRAISIVTNNEEEEKKYLNA